MYDALHSGILAIRYLAIVQLTLDRSASREGMVGETEKQYRGGNKTEKYMYTPGKRGRLWMLIGWLALAGMGCTHIISETVRQQAQPPVSFAELRTDPEALKGRTVILGGEILQTTNLRDGTRLEVLQQPLSKSEVPKVTDTTGGRFMAFCKEYLDPAIYAQHRRITIAGQVLGSFSGKVGEVDYTYPMISCEETHLFPTVSAERYAVYPWWYGAPYYYPWVAGPYPYGFWGPYWRYW
jgi:outer membrane lipoprotein